MDNSEVVCSTASIDEAYDTQLKAYTNMLSSYGVDLATYAGMIGSDEDSFKQEIRQEAKEMAKQSLVLNEIAKQEISRSTIRTRNTGETLRLREPEDDASE